MHVQQIGHVNIACLHHSNVTDPMCRLILLTGQNEDEDLALVLAFTVKLEVKPLLSRCNERNCHVNVVTQIQCRGREAHQLCIGARANRAIVSAV